MQCQHIKMSFQRKAHAAKMREGKIGAEMVMPDGTSERLRKALRDAMGFYEVSDVSELARRAGVKKSRIYNFLNSRSASLTVDAYRAIASALNTSVGSLLGDEPLRKANKTRTIQVTGTLKAGAWVDPLDAQPHENFAVSVPLGSAESKAYGLVVADDSMDLVYPKDTVVICVPVKTFGRPVLNGTRLIVERTNANGHKETTVQELSLHENRTFLWPRSTNPIHQVPTEIPYPAAVLGHPIEMGEVTLQITAVVIGSYRSEIPG